MAFDDRDYNKSFDENDPMDGFKKAMMWFNQSFHIGTLLKTRIAIHIAFPIFIVIYLLSSPSEWAWTLRWQALLFISVLLHEFGHILGCRSVKGHADHILMWPLGGLATCDPPKTAKANLVTVACGPLVNVLLMLISYIALIILLGFGETQLSLNPMSPWAAHLPGLGGWIQDLFVVNYLLLLFNLLLMFYPFDGGRIVQCTIWLFSDYKKSMKIAMPLGVFGAVIVVLIGLVVKEPLLMLIGLFGGYACYQQAQILRMQRYEEEASGGEGWLDLPDSFSLDEESDKPQKKSFLAKRREQKAQQNSIRDREQAKQRDADLDRILQKVTDHGIDSLTKAEKKSLNAESKRKRNS